MIRGTSIAATLAALALVGLTGCGNTKAPSAADDVPSLRVSLRQVDDAMAAHRYTTAEKLLRQLIAVVRRSRDAGDLDAATASDIAGAARRLLAQLEDPEKPSTTEAPTSSPTQDSPAGGSGSRPTQTPTRGTTRQPSSAPSSSPTPEPSDPPTPPSPPPSSDAEPSAEKTPSAADPATADPAAG